MIRKKVSSKGELYFGLLVYCLLECDAVYVGRDLPIPRRNLQNILPICQNTRRHIPESSQSLRYSKTATGICWDPWSYASHIREHLISQELMSL